MEDQKPSEQHRNYKFNELRVYASTEWLADNKKKYRQVFDRYETTYIYAELSFYNKLYDKENWDVDIELRCYETSKIKKQVCQLNFTKKASKFDQIIFIREGWGNKREGTFWKKGNYYWEAWIDNEKIATKYFYVEDHGPKKEENGLNTYVSLQSVKLYEGQYDDVIQDDRSYMISFSSEESRYIYAEINLENKIIKDNWHCELFVKFYNGSRELKGQVVRLMQVKPDDEVIKISAGWGASTKGSWKPGAYSIELIFMDTPLAVVQFSVGDSFVPGLPEAYSPFNRSVIAYPSESNKLGFDEVFAKLNSLIGLTEVKQKVIEHAKYLEFLRLRKSKGFTENERFDIHAVFIGNPGTGKTTVAKMMGLLYRNMGMLSKGHVVEVDRVDLVGEYIGQTAPKTKEVIEKARGGILFIDEAYSLARANDDTKDFGREVVEILIKEMSNGKGDLAVIVAGYPKEMKHFINSNPGLKSRFKHYFDFTDYLSQELIAIAELSARTKEISFTKEAWEFLKSIIINAYRDRDKTFGNARFVLDILDKSKVNMAMRIMARKNPSKLSKSDISEVTLADVLPLRLRKSKDLPDIPIDFELLNDSITALDQLIGIDTVRQQIKDMVQVVQYHKIVGKPILSTFSLHTVLVGNPGTGKTTVARILAKIYKSLGILERGHMVETDRQGLVAGFVGQTAIKTSEKIDEAIGGVLFIDEAYALSNQNNLQGDFGNEAIQTIIKRMEDQRNEFFLFVAGYPSNMDQFLKTNPGLSSRFDRTLIFDDYTPTQLMLIAERMIQNEGYKLSAKAKLILAGYIEELHLKRDKYFGNARTIRKMTLDIIHQQNLRIAAKESKSSNAELITILEPEIMMIKSINEKEISPKKMIGYRNSQN